jgi:hypothetical protein
MVTEIHVGITQRAVLGDTASHARAHILNERGVSSARINRITSGSAKPMRS